MASYKLKALTSSVGLSAPYIDANLLNPWGALRQGWDTWTANNESGTLSRYDKVGALLQSITVSGTGPTNPTGLVKNDSMGFVIPVFGGPASLITVTQQGTINAYNANTTTIAPIVYDSLGTKIFTGASLYNSKLYVANFLSGYVEIYDNTYAFTGQFTDITLQSIGYYPFNVYQYKDKLYVAFAKSNGGDEQKGAGFGYVDVFDLSGVLIKRLINRGALNTPFGLLIHDKKLYVGNFGDGVINVYDLHGTLLGPIRDKFGNIITVDGLWTILLSASHKSIILVAGIDNEAQGLLAILDPTSHC